MSNYLELFILLGDPTGKKKEKKREKAKVKYLRSSTDENR